MNSINSFDFRLRCQPGRKGDKHYHVYIYDNETKVEVAGRSLRTTDLQIANQRIQEMQNVWDTNFDPPWLDRHSYKWTYPDGNFCMTLGGVNISLSLWYRPSSNGELRIVSCFRDNQTDRVVSGTERSLLTTDRITASQRIQNLVDEYDQSDEEEMPKLDKLTHRWIPVWVFRRHGRPGVCINKRRKDGTGPYEISLRLYSDEYHKKDQWRSKSLKTDDWKTALHRLNQIYDCILQGGTSTDILHCISSFKYTYADRGFTKDISPSGQIWCNICKSTVHFQWALPEEIRTGGADYSINLCLQHYVENIQADLRYQHRSIQPDNPEPVKDSDISLTWQTSDDGSFAYLVCRRRRTLVYKRDRGPIYVNRYIYRSLKTPSESVAKARMQQLLQTWDRDPDNMPYYDSQSDDWIVQKQRFYLHMLFNGELLRLSLYYGNRSQWDTGWYIEVIRPRRYHSRSSSNRLPEDRVGNRVLRTVDEQTARLRMYHLVATWNRTEDTDLPIYDKLTGSWIPFWIIDKFGRLRIIQNNDNTTYSENGSYALVVRVNQPNTNQTRKERLCLRTNDWGTAISRRNEILTCIRHGGELEELRQMALTWPLTQEQAAYTQIKGPNGEVWCHRCKAFVEPEDAAPRRTKKDGTAYRASLCMTHYRKKMQNDREKRAYKEKDVDLVEEGLELLERVESITSNEEATK